MPNPVITAALDDLAERRDLGAERAAAVLAEIMQGDADEPQVAAFLIALRTKGETVEEVAGLATTMRRFATKVEIDRDDLLDTAGTGGGRTTFNVSTTAALIAAGAGCPVAKHGNRSATSRSGSADMLEALGLPLDLSPDAVARCVREVGFGFMFAPAHHAATRHVVPVRKALAVRTVFNMLGPLTNPAGASRQVIGTADPHAQDLLAGALAELGVDRALVVRGEDGVDELSTCAPSRVLWVEDGEVHASTMSAPDVGLAEARFEDVEGGDPADNAETARRIFAGERGAPRDLAVLNAGAAICAGGLEPTIESGVRRAEAAIDDGSSERLVERLIDVAKGLEPA